MFDLLDDESLRIGNVLSSDTGERKVEEENGLHGGSLGERCQPHGTFFLFRRYQGW